MAVNHEGSGTDPADAPPEPMGPRRSTYTPPTGEHPLPFMRQESEPERQAEEGPAFEAHTQQPAGERPPQADRSHEEPSAPGAAEQPEHRASALPARPHRTSRQDDELLRTLSPGADTSTSTIEAISQLQAEIDMRQREAREFAEWESRMREIGTPEALESIAEAIPEFTGVIPIVEPPSSPPVSPPPSVPAPAHPASAPESPASGPIEQPPAEEDEPHETTDVTPEPIPPLVEPIGDSSQEPNLSDRLVLQPPWKRDPDPDGEEHVSEHSDVETPGEADEPPADESDEVEAGFAEEQDGSVDVPSRPTARVQFEELLVGTPELPTEGAALPFSLRPDPPTADATEAGQSRQADPPIASDAAEPEQSGQAVFSIELSGDEATPLEHRIGRAARMFWLWFATNSSLVSVAFGAALFGMGMSLRQAIIAAFIGVALSFLPLGLGTLAGKWSGQPTMVVSRATFGLRGNVLPSVLALLTRIFWGAVLLWLVAVCTAKILSTPSDIGGVDESIVAFVAAVVAIILVFAAALFGYPLLARLQLILSIASGVLIVALFVVTWHAVDFEAALTVGDGPWILVVTGVVLVFSFVGLVWANSSGDLARYQRPSGSGASASMWASFGAALPAFVLIAYGALLAASSPQAGRDLLDAPLDAVAAMIPVWYPVPLLVTTVLSLLAGIAMSLYSGSFALRSIGVRVERRRGVALVAIVTFAIALLILMSGTSVTEVFRDCATTLAVPIAAWAGIFGAEVMIRRRRFDERSLLAPGGIYPLVNWTNLAMLVVASVIGFAFTSATVGWLSWQGYGFSLMGVPLRGVVAESDIGVVVALIIGLLTPIVSGVAAIRRQEQAQP